MKKKIGTILSITLLAGALVGCTSTNTPEPTPEMNKPSTNQGITVNKVQYETISQGKAPQTLKNQIEKRKSTRGFLAHRGEDGLYVYIASGEKTTGGFNVEVVSVEDNEGKTIIYVKENTPEKGMITTQAISYPSVTVKMKGTTENVHVYDVTDEDVKMIEAIK
ncbi:hypothetical protein CVD28_01035 [Bacillus sp. M6-12]|uniref:protease complex subunit PrcB family protein n=1 Tax=Bacillus sp. M6-12 TaxID=2054166 RepID=UPI000C75D060|nr:protease complex subunit PrcB family protein [Bacillus sp. M6-12]PLS19018.1 hypothetical protein CVD28_01035 [Bacillus sp. M6-12]